MATQMHVPPLGSPSLRVWDARVTGGLIGVLSAVAGVVKVADGTASGPLDELVSLLFPIVVGGTLLMVARRVPARLLTVITALMALPIAGTAVQHATRGGGAGGAAGSAALVLIVLQLCAFRSRREAWLQAGWATAVLLAVLSVRYGLAGAAGSWAIQATVLAILTVAGTWTRRRFDEMLTELERRADHDPLTGLLNRDGLSRHTAHELARNRYRTGRVDIGVLLLDIDHFKAINDTWGHPAGDEVLVWLSGLLRASVQPPESAVRFGGEEFLLVISGNDLAAAWDRAERLRQLIASASMSLRHPVTVSIGVACGAVPTEGGDLTELYRRADEALYRAKASGRNRVEAAADESAPLSVPGPARDRRGRER